VSRQEDDRHGSSSFNAPFRDLAKLVGPRPAAPTKTVVSKPEPKPSRPISPPPTDDESSLFRDAIRGVRPIPEEKRNHAAPRKPAGGAGRLLTEDEEALAELSDLVSGAAAFDISDTDEHVEGAVSGLDPRILRRLRAGEFAHQAHFDLHGMTLDEAKIAVREFILRSMVAGRRCVLIVHGRGRNSPDQRPVLKDAVKLWLTRGELARRVLAFSTARSYDGGSGAMYVLLRRERRQKAPFQTFSGAKS
jgi:DNA-nicking Smr family endonuclease